MSHLKNTDKYYTLVTKSAAILFMLGLLTGIHVTLVATGKIDGSIQASLAAHLNGIIGSLIVLSLLIILPGIKYGHTYKRNLMLMFIISNYANWLITFIKSIAQVEGITILDNAPLNNIIHILLVLFVVLPSITGAALWIFGISNHKH